MSLNFAWDEDKARANKKKHRVTFEDAASVFDDPLAVIFDDEIHLEEEQRELIIGHSARDRLLLVCFTERRRQFASSVLAALPNRSVKTMRKTRSSNRAPNPGEDMLREYRFDYSKARPNRFAARPPASGREVLLDPDVAEVFTTPKSVNAVLRALIATMPKRRSG